MDQDLLSQALAGAGSSNLFTHTNTGGTESLAVFDEVLLEKVEAAVIRGCHTQTKLLKQVPELQTSANAKAYLKQMYKLFGERATQINRDAERQRMVGLLWDVINESYVALDLLKENNLAQHSSGVVKNIIAAEQRISALMGLNAPQEVDVRVQSLITLLGPIALKKAKALQDPDVIEGEATEI